MTVEADFELVEGTGNVFQDLGDPDAGLKQAKALLAADIISALDNSGLSVRKAGEATGFAAADFSRIRSANLGRFTVDRLMRILSALDRASASPNLGRRSVALPTLESGHPVPKPIIVDKSYAQGARSLSSFQRSWCLLFPDAFFFEVASTDPQARERCLAKLREVHGHGGLRVAPNVGELLRKEIHDLNRAGPPSDNLIGGLDLDAFFSIKFDILSKARREALQSTEADFGQDINGLITRTQMLQRCFPSTCEGTTANRREAFRLVRQTVADDREFLLSFFADFVCHGAHTPPGAPLLAEIARNGTLGPEWTIYRWLQVQLLYGLEWLEKYPKLAANTLMPKQRERLQHDVIDMEYVVLGVLQGALATKDKRMAAMFMLLQPDGVVLPSASVA